MWWLMMDRSINWDSLQRRLRVCRRRLGRRGMFLSVLSVMLLPCMFHTSFYVPRSIYVSCFFLRPITSISCCDDQQLTLVFRSKLGGQALVLDVEGTWRELTGVVNKLAANLTSQVCFFYLSSFLYELWGHGVRTRPFAHLFHCTFCFLLVHVFHTSSILFVCTLHASSLFTFHYITSNTSGIPSLCHSLSRLSRSPSPLLLPPALTTSLPPPIPIHARYLPISLLY